MAKNTAYSSLVHVKDENGVYQLSLPINTLKEVYYDIDKKITLEEYFNSIHIVPIIHHIDGLDQLSDLPGDKDIKVGDLLTVGRVESNSLTSGMFENKPMYTYFVKDTADLTNIDSYIRIGIGTQSEYGYTQYITKFSLALDPDEWVDATPDNLPDDYGNNKSSVHPYWDGGDDLGYMYMIKVPDNLLALTYDSGTTDFDIDFTEARDLELASELEIIPRYMTIYNDGQYIVIFSTRKPSRFMNVTVTCKTIYIPKRPE